MSTKLGGWMGEDTGKKKKGGEIGRDEKKNLFHTKPWMFSQYPTGVLYFCEPTAL